MNKKNDVGVIIGRFQVDELHEAHIDLISQVIEHNYRTIILLGLSPVKVTRNNPLDFETRKNMIQEKFPDVTVLYIRDVQSDVEWSKNLDRQIADLVGPEASVILYGGRDGFMKHYTGRFQTHEMSQKVYASGTDIRSRAGKTVKSDNSFRKGVIWATANQYMNAIPTVDIAPVDISDIGVKVLMAKKPEEDKYRFVGGFSSGVSTYEDDARREAEEETGGCKFGKMDYVGSFVIDDWRYRSERNKIVTSFFMTTLEHGVPVPSDDLAGGLLAWFNLECFVNLDWVMPEHRQLAKALAEKLKS